MSSLSRSRHRAGGGLGQRIESQGHLRRRARSVWQRVIAGPGEKRGHEELVQSSGVNGLEVSVGSKKYWSVGARISDNGVTSRWASNSHRGDLAGGDLAGFLHLLWA